jgi:hypothetical protein
LNLSVKGIDTFARSKFIRILDPAKLGASLRPLHRNLAYISIWAVVFAGMSATQAVGDNHPGQWLPFWRHACQDGRAYACPYLADVELSFCDRGSGWACNEAGLMDIALSRSGEDLRRLNPARAAEPFKRGCGLGFDTACQNLGTLTSGTSKFTSSPPRTVDYPIILRGSKGEIRGQTPSELYALACDEGWDVICRAEAAIRPK